MLGPTASGKSAIAEALAARFDAEIVSVDSMQVYRGMDIGTAKPSPEVRSRIPHHMIDIVDPEVDFSVSEFQTTGRAALASIDDRNRPAVVCGGSGLHFRALVDPLRFPPTDPVVRGELENEALETLAAELLAVDPGAGEHVDLANPRRVVRAVEILRLTGRGPSDRAADPEADRVRRYEPEHGFTAIGIDPGDRSAERIVARVDAMLADGLVDEVASLAPRLGRSAAQAVGYKELLPVVAGDGDLATARRAIIDATNALAKRQRTFFRRDPRIRWLAWHDGDERRVAEALAAFEEAGTWSS